MSNIRQIDEKEQSRTLNDEKKDTRDRAKEEFGRIAKMWDFFLCDGEDGLFFPDIQQPWSLRQGYLLSVLLFTPIMEVSSCMMQWRALGWEGLMD